jgi:hypothetical protein
MLLVIKHVTGAVDVAWPLDIYIAEANTFLTLLAYPYASLALGVQLVILIAVWWAHESGRTSAVLAAAFGAAFLAFTHAYDLVIIGGVTGAFAVTEWIRHRIFPRRLFITGIVMAASSAPFLWYYSRLTSTDPLWRAVLAQYPNAGVWTPTPPHLVVLMGVPLLLAALGLATSRPRSAADWYVVTWAVAGLGLIYLPIVYQVKMLAGWQLPLAILAARGWTDRVQPPVTRALARIAALNRRGWREAGAVVALLVLVTPTNLYLFMWRFMDLARIESPYYFSRDDNTALQWLALNATPADVVLAPIAFGRLVPGYSGARSYLAHWAMTNRYFEREARVARFFAPDTSDGWRRSLLDEERVTLVVRVAAVGDGDVYDPSASAGFERILMLPRLQVFRFNRAR